MKESIEINFWQQFDCFNDVYLFSHKKFEHNKINSSEAG